MKIKHIKFKISAGATYNCGKCKEKVRGKEGFVEIYYVYDYGMYSNNTKIRICWKCFSEFQEECNSDREGREEKYTKLIKRRMAEELGK